MRERRGPAYAAPVVVSHLARRAAIGALGAAVGAIASTAVGLAQPQARAADAAAATLCVALRAGTSAFLRDQLGCSPDLPPLPAELRPCRVSLVSTETGAHRRSVWTLGWSDDGRLEQIESGGVVQHFEYASGHLSEIRGEDATSRDERIAYEGSDVIVDSRMRSGAGLRIRTRYVHENGQIVRIETTFEPRPTPDTITTLARTRGRIAEIVTQAGGEASRARVSWDARGRPRSWVPEGVWRDPYFFEWDPQDRFVRAALGASGSRASQLLLVEYACAAPVGPVRTPDGVLFCRGSADCGPGERCVRARSGAPDATYCAGRADESVIVVEP